MSTTDNIPEGGYLIPAAFIAEMLAAATGPSPFSHLRSNYVPKPLTRRQRMHVRVVRFRERIGFAIAGYTPGDFDD